MMVLQPFVEQSLVSCSQSPPLLHALDYQEEFSFYGSDFDSLQLSTQLEILFAEFQYC